MSALSRYHSPMTDAQIKAIAPSVFAAEAHESRSDKYTYLPTIDVLNGLRREGFEVFEARQSRTRDASKRDFTSHVLRLRHPNADGLISGNGEDVEIVLRNSHDGASSFQLSQGIFRQVCSNGLVVGTTQATISIPHRGDVLGDVIEGSYRIIEDSKQIAEVIADWRSVELSPVEQTAMGLGAAKLRFPDLSDEELRALAPKLIKSRRYFDSSNDLWATFNRAQENVIKGGTLLGYDQKTGRRKTARAVTGLDQDLKLNKGLWQMADFLFKVKQGQADLEELVA